MSSKSTEHEIQRMIPNRQNHLAWSIAAGLAGWMQLCCSKLIGGHIREDPARMILVEILQAQQATFWLRINGVPDGWGLETQKYKVDVCLGEPEGGSISKFGVIELKWPWTVPDEDRIGLSEDIMEDIARLVTVETSAEPNIRYFVLGCMWQAYKPLFANSHRKESREKQRILMRRLLSFDIRKPERQIARRELLDVFPDAEQRIPTSARRRDYGIVRTRLLAAQQVIIGMIRFGGVFVWQCDYLQPTTKNVTEANAKS